MQRRVSITIRLTAVVGMTMKENDGIISRLVRWGTAVMVGEFDVVGNL